MTLIYRKQTDNPNNVKIVYFRDIPADKDDTGYTGKSDESILRGVPEGLKWNAFSLQHLEMAGVSRKIVVFLLAIICRSVLG